MHSISVGFIVASVIIVALFALLFGHIKEFLKDDAPTNPVKPYSLGRTILFFWTVIVVFSICYLGIVLDEMPNISDSTLMLMGIVVGTSGTARVIDYVQISNGVARHQEKFPGQNLLFDIISDQNGLSIHRFQTVMFNVIYGGYFLSSVFADLQMPTFSDTVLGLLGISSGTYALLKIPENSATSSQQSQQPALQAGNQPVQQPMYASPMQPSVPPVAITSVPVQPVPATTSVPADADTNTPAS